ncbi:MAG: ATP-binding protein [Prevotella sp.]|jgi:anti-sigma regulatory factor (Ser/Thr protein kinase)|nr:ATP-binding protein [Prevotella sp.]
MTKKLTLHNDVQQISKLADFVDAIAEEASIDPSLAMSLNLALEEAVTNVVMYAYPAGEEGDVDIVAELSDGSLLFTISDKGIPFDPTKKEDADITLGVEERQIGGLGIFLVRQLMDTVEYERKDGYNILTMKKKL